MDQKALNRLLAWRNDWNLFVKEVLHANLDKEQQEIISSVQYNPRTVVASGTSRGKDFVTACACLSFMYLTPRFDEYGNLIKNTKVAMTAPTERQVKNIMTPEIRRLMRNAMFLPGRLVANDIRTDYEEWFLTGFKAGDDNTEAWTGFHAVNTMFAVTEASGVADSVFDAIEGNLQGNSRLLLVLNTNTTVGYAARAMKSNRFKKFRLNSLNAENVRAKKIIIPGQVDYDWVKDKLDNWCKTISDAEYDEGQGDFEYEGIKYRPNDLFRIKVLGMFPKASEDALIPFEWIEEANNRWEELNEKGFKPTKSCRLGVDVAGMGRDSSILLPRYGNYVGKIISHQSSGQADHMHIVGLCNEYLNNPKNKIFIDTIGEGAGCYSRMIEIGYDNAISCKFSFGAQNLHDITGVHTFANIRAYCYWAIRDWLNPKNGFMPALPPDDKLAEELTEIKWKFHSKGYIIIESKENVKSRLKRSPDKSDALAQTFYPDNRNIISDEELLEDFM